MKKEGLGVAIGTGLALLSVIGVMASNITDATFYGTIQISNNGSAATNQPVTFTLNTTNLISSGFVNAALNNTAMRNNANADTAYMPGLTPNPWVFFVNSIPGPGANLNYTLYTGGNHTMNSTLAYFPGAAGMTTTDNVSLEPSANFSLNLTGFIDATYGANKTIFSKVGSLTATLNATNKIAVTILTSTNYSPTNNVSNVGWTAPGNVFDNNTATRSEYSDPAGITSTVFTLNNTATLANRLWFKSDLTAGAGNTIIEAFYGGVWNTVFNGPNKSSGGFVTLPTYPIPQNITQVRFSMTGSGIGTVYQMYEIYYDYLPYLESNITTGNHSFVASANVTHFSLSVDGVTSNSCALNTASVKDNANDWVVGSANTTPYIYRWAISINGTPRQDIIWQYAASFADTTGNGNTAVPTFLTSTSSPNLTANMTTFQPVVQSVSVPNGTALVAANITSTFISPPHMFTELSITAPGADFINSVLNGVGIPRALFWFPFLFGITNLVGLLVAFLTKSIFVECAFMGVLLVLFSFMGGFGFWVCLEYIIGASAIVVFSKQFGF